MANNSSPPNLSPSASSSTSTPPPTQPSSSPPQSPPNTNATSPPPSSSPPPFQPSSFPPQSLPNSKATSPPPSSVSPPPLQPSSPPPKSPSNTIATSPPPTSVLPSPPQSPGASAPNSGGTSPPLAPKSPPPTPTTFPSPPPPLSSTPPPPVMASPPPSSPPLSSPPPPSPNPSTSAPPPSPSPVPPKNSSLTPTSNPPASPPPPSKPPKSPPPPPPISPVSSPPPQPSPPPQKSPPPSPSDPPQSSPPPPTPNPLKNSPPPPRVSPPPPKSPSQSPSPPPTIHLSPPSPSLLSPPSPSPPPQVLDPPPGNPTSNSSSGNATEISNPSGNGGLGTGGVVAIGLVLGLILLGVIGIAACFVTRKKRTYGLNCGNVMPTSQSSSPKAGSALLKAQASASQFVNTSGSETAESPSNRGVLGNSRSWFTYEELLEATNGFSEQNLLGEGGFGSVYKGLLLDGKEIAVKQLKIGGEQGEREFKAEVEIISRIHHRHLVSLVGYCISESRRLLVFEYVPNNTLHFHLHGKGRPVVDWATRVKIAAGAARGIAYLHEDCHPRIIHRDIKSANILLDNNFEARVSDFGLAKLAVDANTHVSTRVVGTFGYMAPEYASSGKLTEKSDIYSFGVVILELITGRRPVDTSQPLGEESLVEWARPLLGQVLDTEEFEGLADPRLEKNYVDSEMLQMIEIAAACVRHSAAKRPRMGQVVRSFDSMVASDITNGVPVGESEIFITPTQSSEIRWFRRMAFGNQDFSTEFFSQSRINRSSSDVDAV